MALSCACPAAAALPNIPKFECSEGFGQIQKIAFQRIYNGATRNSFRELGMPGKIQDLSSWTMNLTANNSTKIVISPFVENPTQDGGDARTYGGGNDTLGGVSKIIGAEPTTLTVQLRDVPQSVIKELKKLMCEAQNGNLGVYLFDDNGRIEALEEQETIDNETIITNFPIPIRALFVGDKIHGGLENPDSNTMSFQFAPNYSDNLAIVTPSFNPLTEL